MGVRRPCDPHPEWAADAGRHNSIGASMGLRRAAAREERAPGGMEENGRTATDFERVLIVPGARAVSISTVGSLVKGNRQGLLPAISLMA